MTLVRIRLISRLARQGDHESVEQALLDIEKLSDAAHNLPNYLANMLAGLPGATEGLSQELVLCESALRETRSSKRGKQREASASQEMISGEKVDR